MTRRHVMRPFVTAARQVRGAVSEAARAAWLAGLSRYVPRIVRTLPHDRLAFTQGLALHDGCLYESTGGIGQSTLRCIDPTNGDVIQCVAVANVWAEGIAVHGEEIIQLTWRNEAAYVYARPELRLLRTVSYDGEGWGLASYSDEFVMTNGSHVISFRDRDFRIVREQPVHLKGVPLRHLNDIVIVGDRLYANVWFATEIFEIALRTGRVLGFVDCSELMRRVDCSDAEHVLNGIAHDPVTGHFLVTGKCWPVIFEVVFEEKPSSFLREVLNNW